jgi:hypothetical protein
MLLLVCRLFLGMRLLRARIEVGKMSMCEIGGEKDVEDAQNADSGRRSWRALGGVAHCGCWRRCFGNF